MARPSLKSVEYSFYFPSPEDKARWKQLAHPLTLNRWIYLMVEKALENEPAPRDGGDSINILRKEVVELRQENTALAAKLERSQQDLASSRDSLPLEQSLLGLFKLFIRGGTWTPAEINKQFFTEFHNDINISKAVNKSLELLEDSELVEKTQTGWRLYDKNNR
jgi:hypothetical protein